MATIMTIKKTDKGKKENKTTKKAVKPSAAKTNKSNKDSVAPVKKKSPKTEQQEIVASPAVFTSLAKPNEKDALRMVVDVMNDFITAKQEKSMEHFFHTIAKKWQDITTVEKLNASFRAVIADEANWNFLKTVQPSIIKDGLSERGDWVVVGVYPTKPKKLIFDQIFINENNEWKIAELKLFTAD